MEKAIVSSVWILSIMNLICGTFQAIYTAATITSGLMGSRIEYEDLNMFYPVFGVLATILLIVGILKVKTRFKKSLIFANSINGIIYASITIGYHFLRSA